VNLVLNHNEFGSCECDEVFVFPAADGAERGYKGVKVYDTIMPKAGNMKDSMGMKPGRLIALCKNARMTTQRMRYGYVCSLCTESNVLKGERSLPWGNIGGTEASGNRRGIRRPNSKF